MSNLANTEFILDMQCKLYSESWNDPNRVLPKIFNLVCDRRNFQYAWELLCRKKGSHPLAELRRILAVSCDRYATLPMKRLNRVLRFTEPQTTKSRILDFFKEFLEMKEGKVAHRARERTSAWRVPETDLPMSI